MNRLPITLATVASRIDSIPGLTDRKRQEIRAAVLRVGCLAHPSCDPAQVPVDSLAAVARLDAVTPMALNCSKKRRDNILSLVRRAIARTTDSHSLPVGDWRPSGAWAAILDSPKKDPLRPRKCAAKRIARWAEDNGYEPETLPADTFDRMYEWQKITSWCQNPHKATMNAVRAWNQLVAGGAAGTSVPVRKRERLWLVRDDMPASFRTEFDNYLSYCRDPLPWRAKRAGCAPRSKPYAEATIRCHRDAILAAATLLVRAGMPIDQITRLNVLGASENARRIMEEFEKA